MSLASAEGVVVGDDDLGPLDVAEHVGRHEFALAVIAVRIVRQQHAQPILDRDAGRDDQEAAGEVVAARMAHRIDRLPGDQHRHDRGLAGAGRQLQRDAHQLGVRLLVGAADMRPDPGACRRTIGGDLGQPDRGLDRLDLAEERANVLEIDDAASAGAAGRSPASPATGSGFGRLRQFST